MEPYIHDGVTRAASWRLLALLCTVVVVLTACGLKTVRVSGDAMAPTLKDGDIRTVDTSAYSTATPRRGDIVAYHTNRLGRVIGLPGETIAISGGSVAVNGAVLNEPYLAPGTQTTAPQDHYVVPSGSYFILNDNRAHVGGDSRTLGFVPLSDIQGRIG